MHLYLRGLAGGAGLGARGQEGNGQGWPWHQAVNPLLEHEEREKLETSL